MNKKCEQNVGIVARMRIVHEVTSQQAYVLGQFWEYSFS
jgi:hypothetical protein